MMTLELSVDRSSSTVVFGDEDDEGAGEDDGNDDGDWMNEENSETVKVSEVACVSVSYPIR